MTIWVLQPFLGPNESKRERACVLSQSPPIAGCIVSTGRVIYTAFNTRYMGLQTCLLICPLNSYISLANWIDHYAASVLLVWMSRMLPLQIRQPSHPVPCHLLFESRANNLSG